MRGPAPSPADGEAPSQSPRPPPPPPDPSPGPEAALSEATSSNQGFPSSCLGQRLLSGECALRARRGVPGDRASASSSAAAGAVGRRECPAEQSDQKTPKNYWSSWDLG